MDVFRKRFQLGFFLILLGLTAIVVFMIVRPLLAPLILAVSLGLVFSPFHKQLTRFFHNKTIASFVTLLIVIVLVIVPLAVVTYLLFNEALDLYAGFTTGQFSNINVTVAHLNQYLDAHAPGIHIDLAAYAEETLSWIVSNLGTFFSEFFSIGLKTFLLMLTLFYFFQSGKEFKTKLIETSPLPSEYDQKIIDRLSNAVVSVIRGSLIVGVVQGLAAGIGTSLFGLPNPVIWGVLAACASFVPGVGTLLVMGPAIISRFAFGYYMMGSGLLIWYIVTLIIVDNMLSPYLIERGTKIHSLFILISILGGVVVFGPIGFILGPIFLALFFALLEIYPLLMK